MAMFRNWSFLLSFIVTLLIQSISSSDKGCNFKHDGCTYNIYLNHKDDKNTGTPDIDCGNRHQQVFIDRAQNDYTAKIDDIEKNFSFLKDAHEQRIKELESTVKELLGLDKEESENSKTQESVEISKESSFSFRNDVIMTKLEAEFNKLREAIRQKGHELMDTKIKLNETGIMMHEIQLQHFKSSQELINAENEITMLKRERSILKNQLKDRSYNLDISSKRAEECDTKSNDQQNQIMELFRSENNLKEELLTVQLMLNESEMRFEDIEEKHESLKSRHERVRVIMKMREQELIDCYSSKTSTFCGFEDPKICGFTNINDTSDFFNWERGKGQTPSARTGPPRDHTCQGPNGHFMFIEASAKGRGSNAILYSPLYRGLTEQCVEFFYHMYGRHIGTLNVYAQTRGDVLRSAWRAYGNQGDVWTNARLAIPKELAMAGYQIAFEGITENGYQGDISIDDVSVTDGPCPVDEKTIPVQVAINSTSVIKEGKTFARKLRNKIKKNSRSQSRES